MFDVSFLLILIIIVALIFDFTNGAHDCANAIATVVSTKVLSPRTAVIMAATLNLIGQEIFISQGFGGEGGIRTPGTLLTYTRFPGEHLRPLRHLSMIHLLFYIRQPLPNCLRIIISYPCRNTSKIYLFILMNFSRYFLIIFFYSGQNKATDS